MASLFRARCPAEEGGSGGKIIRGRRAPPSSSPYAHPLPPPLPLPPAPTGSPRWLFGLVSGAGKFISSMFRSDGGYFSPSSSSDYSSDEDHGPRSNEQENIGVPKELHQFNQGLKKPELIFTEGSHAIVRISETKLAIEKLLRQEAFSRDECDRLTKLIHSRVVEFPSPQLVQDGVGWGSANRVTGNDVDSSEDWRSLKQKMELPESAHYSPNNLNSLSPKSPASRACAPVIRSTVIMEAKRWLEEKKLPSNSNFGPVCGPCNLNTEMLSYDIHDKAVSPVDLAKSYMRSLPRPSPSFGSSGIKTPLSSRVDFGMDDSTCATTTHSLPPFKDFKRKYLSARLWESPDDNRRVRLKSAENMLESHGSKQNDSLGKLFQNETSKFPSAADEKDEGVLGMKYYSCSSQAVEISSAPAKSSAELLVEHQCSKDALNLPGEKAAKASPLTLTDKPTSINIASEPKEAVESAIETVLPTISSSDPSESRIENEPKLLLAFDEDKDVIEPSQTKEQEGIVESDIPHESLISASTLLEHENNMSVNVVAVPEGIKSTTLSDADGVTNLDNTVQISSANTAPIAVGTLEANNSAELNLDPDAKLQDEDHHSQHELNGLANDFSTNGGSNANSQSICEEDQSRAHFSNGEQTTGISGETSGLPSEAAINTESVYGIDNSTGKSDNGTRMKSIERALIQPESSPGAHRTRAVAKRRESGESESSPGAHRTRAVAKRRESGRVRGRLARPSDNRQ